MNRVIFSVLLVFISVNIYARDYNIGEYEDQVQTAAWREYFKYKIVSTGQYQYLPLVDYLNKYYESDSSKFDELTAIDAINYANNKYKQYGQIDYSFGVPLTPNHWFYRSDKDIVRARGQMFDMLDVLPTPSGVPLGTSMKLIHDFSNEYEWNNQIDKCPECLLSEYDNRLEHTTQLMEKIDDLSFKAFIYAETDEKFNRALKRLLSPLMGNVDTDASILAFTFQDEVFKRYIDVELLKNDVDAVKASLMKQTKSRVSSVKDKISKQPKASNTENIDAKQLIAIEKSRQNSFLKSARDRYIRDLEYAANVSAVNLLANVMMLGQKDKEGVLRFRQGMMTLLDLSQAMDRYDDAEKHGSQARGAATIILADSYFRAAISLIALMRDAEGGDAYLASMKELYELLSEGLRSLETRLIDIDDKLTYGLTHLSKQLVELSQNIEDIERVSIDSLKEILRQHSTYGNRSNTIINTMLALEKRKYETQKSKCFRQINKGITRDEYENDCLSMYFDIATEFSFDEASVVDVSSYIVEQSIDVRSVSQDIRNAITTGATDRYLPLIRDTAQIVYGRNYSGRVMNISVWSDAATVYTDMLYAAISNAKFVNPQEINKVYDIGDIEIRGFIKWLAESYEVNNSTESKTDTEVTKNKESDETETSKNEQEVERTTILGETVRHYKKYISLVQDNLKNFIDSSQKKYGETIFSPQFKRINEALVTPVKAKPCSDFSWGNTSDRNISTTFDTPTQLDKALPEGVLIAAHYKLAKIDVCTQGLEWVNIDKNCEGGAEQHKECGDLLVKFKVLVDGKQIGMLKISSPHMLRQGNTGGKVSFSLWTKEDKYLKENWSSGFKMKDTAVHDGRFRWSITDQSIDKAIREKVIAHRKSEVEKEIDKFLVESNTTKIMDQIEFHSLMYKVVALYILRDASVYDVLVRESIYTDKWMPGSRNIRKIIEDGAIDLNKVFISLDEVSNNVEFMDLYAHSSTLNQESNSTTSWLNDVLLPLQRMHAWVGNNQPKDSLGIIKSAADMH